MIGKRWALTLLAGSLTGLPVQGILALESPESSFFDAVEVEVASVEVVVEDAAGNKVSGLEAADFEILEDRVSQPITYFSFLNTVEAPNLLAPEEEATPAPPATPASPASPTPGRTQLAIFLDDAHLSKKNRQEVLRELTTYLETSLSKQDLVLLARISDKLVVEQSFTSDQALLAAALARMQESTWPKATDADYRRILRDVTSTQLASAGEPGSGFSAGIEMVAMDARAQARDILVFGKERQEQVQRSLASLQDTVNSLAGLPGRKALIYVSDGLPMRATESLAEAWREKYENWAIRNGKKDLLGDMSRARSMAFEGQTTLNRLADRASASRVAFYVLAPDGQGARSLGAGEVVGSAGSAIAQEAATSELFEGRASLLQLADATGGRAQTGRTAITDLLEKVREDFGCFYSLGYKSAQKAQDGLRRIEVRIKDRPDLRLRYTRVLGHQDPLEELRQLTLSALQFGLSDNPLQLEIETQAVSPLGKDHYYVDVVIKLPFEKLLLLPRADRFVGRLTLFVLVRDDSTQDISTMSQVEVPLDVSAEQHRALATQTAIYPLRIEMKGGLQRLAIGLRDHMARSAASLEVDLDVPRSLTTTTALPVEAQESSGGTL